MAVVIEHVYTAEDETLGVSTLTVANVVGGDGNLLVLMVAIRANASQTINSVTYNGSSTGITEIISGDADSRPTAVYYLANPAGTANVVFTFSANAISTGTVFVLSGADTASPVRDSDESNDFDAVTSRTLTLTAQTDDMAFDVLTRSGANETLTVGADQTQQSAQDVSGVMQHRTSNQAGSTSTEMSWSWTTGVRAYYAAVAIAATATGGPAPGVGALSLAGQAFPLGFSILMPDEP